MIPTKIPFLTPCEAARLLGVRDSKVFDWIRSGELQAVNLAASKSKTPRYRIRQDAIEQFLHSRIVRPEPDQQPRRRKAAVVTATKWY